MGPVDLSTKLLHANACCHVLWGPCPNSPHATAVPSARLRPWQVALTLANTVSHPSGRALDWFPVWGVTLPAPARGRDGSAKCPSGSSARACWVKAAAPLLPGGDPVTGDVTPEGCPAMFIRKSGLADAGVQAALGKLRQLAAASGGKCGGVLP